LTARRTFFLVFKGLRGPNAVLYFDDLPSKDMLRTLPPVLYRRELTGTQWANASLTEIVDEYERRLAEGNVPPDNTTRPPIAKPKDQLGLGHRERPWRVGDLALQK
jgi:hypothetical protein